MSLYKCGRRGAPTHSHCLEAMVHQLVEVEEQGRGRGHVPVLEHHVTEYLVGQHSALGVAGGEGTRLGKGEGGGGGGARCDGW